MRFGELTYREIELAARGDSLLLLPTGCLEQQGPHLPVDMDTWLAEEVVLASAEKVWVEHGLEALVLPAVPFGPTPEHRGFGAGYIDLPQPLHEAILTALLYSLVDQGFRRILVWRGCGQHKLERAIDRFGRVGLEGASVELAPDIYDSIWRSHGIPNMACGHADAFVTSIALYRRPEAVRQDQIRGPAFTIPDWDDPELDLSKHTDSGSIGDPSQASAELGQVLWDSIVARAADLIVDFAARTSEHSRQ